MTMKNNALRKFWDNAQLAVIGFAVAGGVAGIMKENKQITHPNEYSQTTHHTLKTAIKRAEQVAAQSDDPVVRNNGVNLRYVMGAGY